MEYKFTVRQLIDRCNRHGCVHIHDKYNILINICVLDEYMMADESINWLVGHLVALIIHINITVLCDMKKCVYEQKFGFCVY